jgi:hypothetical protein
MLGTGKRQLLRCSCDFKLKVKAGQMMWASLSSLKGGLSGDMGNNMPTPKWLFLANEFGQLSLTTLVYCKLSKLIFFI